MDIWIKAAQLLLSLSILIVLHEAGHYFAARLFKIKVEKFYLFFDWKFSLFKKKIGDTEYGVGWLPLGGYVKIAGMIDESMDKDQMAQPPKPDEFRSKPAWQRLIVMAAGVIVNTLLGFFIYTVIIAYWGEDVISNDTLKYGIAVDENFKKLNTGIEDGDIITAVNGEAVENAKLVNIQVFLRKARDLEVQKPNGEKISVTLDKDVNKWMWQNDAMLPFSPRVPTVVDSVMQNRDIFVKGLKKGDSLVSVNGLETPFYNNFKTALNELTLKEGDTVIPVNLGYYRDGVYHEMETVANAKKTLGFNVAQPTWLKPTHKDYSFGESIPRGFKKAGWMMYDYTAQLPLIFTKKGASSVGGFGAIGGLFPPKWDWIVFWTTTAFISLILAIMNILPIPALDGGHIMFLFYEIITGKAAPQKVMEYAQVIGFVILITLVVFANGNDIYRAFFK